MLVHDEALVAASPRRLVLGADTFPSVSRAGKYDLALDKMKEALEIRSRALGADHVVRAGPGLSMHLSRLRFPDVSCSLLLAPNPLSFSRALARSPARAHALCLSFARALARSLAR
eukprot:3143224-Rhodomonas_salina.1